MFVERNVVGEKPKEKIEKKKYIYLSLMRYLCIFFVVACHYLEKVQGMWHYQFGLSITHVPLWYLVAICGNICFLHICM